MSVPGSALCSHCPRGAVGNVEIYGVNDAFSWYPVAVCMEEVGSSMSCYVERRVLSMAECIICCNGHIQLLQFSF